MTTTMKKKWRIGNSSQVSREQWRQLGAKCLVTCLSTTRELRRLERKRAPPPIDGQYWAEAIRDARLNKDCALVLRVKWEGYEERVNTWQTVKDLSGSDVLFELYFRHSFGPKHVTYYTERDFQHLAAILSELTRDECDKAVLLMVSDVTDGDVFRRTETQWRAMRSRVRLYCEALRNHRTASVWVKRILIRLSVKELKIEENFGDFQQFVTFCEKREKCVKSLKQWERRVNLALNKEDRIRVENGVDCQQLPEIQYLLKYSIVAKIEPKKRSFPFFRCDCEDDCRKNRTCLCALALYRDNKRFKSSNIVYECGERCRCGQECPNRRIQKARVGRDLCVFRTRDRGWGVMTTRRLPFGAFIMEYCGEVIDSTQTLRRDSNYFFQLDEEFCGQTLFVDGSQKGNVARFANHSCEPNMAVHLAIASDADLVPRVAFFASRPIAAFEELTWDYKRTTLSADGDGNYVHSETSSLDSGYAGSGDAITCLCGAKKCKGFV